MSAESAFRFILLSDTPVNALCGGAASESFRCWIGERPQGSQLPAITVHLDSIDPLRHKDLSVPGMEIDEEHILVYCYALTYDVCRDLANKIRTALDYRFKSETTISNINIHYIRIEDEDYFIDNLVDNNVHTIEQRFLTRVRR